MTQTLPPSASSHPRHGLRRPRRILLALSLAGAVASGCVGDAPSTEETGAAGTSGGAGVAGAAGASSGGGGKSAGSSGASGTAGASGKGTGGSQAGAGQAGKGGTGQSGAGQSGAGQGGSAGGAQAGTGGQAGAGKAGASGAGASGASGAGASGASGAGQSGSSGAGGSAAGSAGAAGKPAPTCNASVCGDPGCDAFACVPNAPAGWIGPFSLYDAASAPPSCTQPSGNNVLDAHSALVSEPASCSACTCGAGKDPECIAYVDEWTQGSCSGHDTWQILPAHTQGCTNAGGDAQSVSTIHLGTTSLLYNCPPSQVTTTVPPPKWGHQLRGCAPAFPQAKGCGAGSACQPLPDAPFENRLCVAQDGDVACPTQTFQMKRLAYKGVTDTRGCDACKCNSMNGACSFSATLYSGFDCSGGTVANVTLGGSEMCFAGGAARSAGGFSNVNLPSSLSCAPAGGAPNGTITAGSPVTICCSP